MKRLTAQDQIDRFDAAASSERLRSDLVDALEDEPFSKFAEWAETLQAVADAIEQAKDALENWRDEDEKEAKADAREEAVEALAELVNTWNNAPLDLSKITDWSPA